MTTLSNKPGARNVTALAENIDRDTCQPNLFDASQGQQYQGLLELVGDGRVDAIADTILDQIGELVETRTPQRDFSAEELRGAALAFLGDTPPHLYGTWVYYPWSRRLVHVLPRDEFREVRTSRNRNKITTVEQQKLQNLTLAIVGLSVGRATATTLALEGIGGEFRLADFDTQSLSNMNRLRTPLHDLGINKAVSCARELFEIDPYLTVRVLSSGVTNDGIDDVLDDIDLLFEECDSMAMKLRLRERARALRIPVLMETSDRGMIDIERFDLEPDRPLFHGLIAGVDVEDLEALTTEEKVPIVLRILGIDTMSKRFAASLFDIDTTLNTWPQLASGVALGGALNAAAARRIALGQLTSSGRYHADIEDVLCDGGAAFDRVEIAPEPDHGPAPEPKLPELTAASWPPSEEDVRTLVAHAAAAPSGGNCQPWTFRWADGALVCRHDTSRSRTMLDHGHRASHLSLGAAAENVALAARAMGLEPSIAVFPEGDEVVWRVTFAPGEPSEQNRKAAEGIARRHTNRRLGQRVPLDCEILETLESTAHEAGARLQVRSGDGEMDAIADILAAGDRVRFLSPTLHREMYGELRWPPQPAHVGLDVRTLELTPSDMAGLRLGAKEEVMRTIRAVEGGQGLGKMARRAIAATSAVGVLSIEGDDLSTCVAGGRALQRVWLAANGSGLALQPWAPLIYLFHRLEDGAIGFTNWEADELHRIRERFIEIFPRRANEMDIMLFRLGIADPPTARSLRLGVDEVLSFA